MTQRFSFWEDLTIRENLDFVARIYQMRNRREAVDRALERSACKARANQLDRVRSPAAGSSGSRWPPACCTSRNCCCSTSRPPASIPPRGATSGKNCIGSRRAASRCSSARTTWTKRSAVTSSPTSRTASCSRRAPRSEVIAAQDLTTWAIHGDHLTRALRAPARHARRRSDRRVRLRAACQRPAITRRSKRAMRAGDARARARHRARSPRASRTSSSI